MIIAQHLSKTYGKRKVVKDVSFSFDRGEVVGLLGPNGAGKTTSFYMIIGIVESDVGGQVLLNGKNISNLPIHIRAQLGIGYLPQEPSIFRSMTVTQNIMSILEIHIKNKTKRFDKLEELLNDFSITHIRDSVSSSLSGGERRRLEIARLLAINPSYILLDEPFAGVDPIAVREVRDIIYKLKNKNIGVLITDHNVHETLKTVDKTYVIHNGSVICSGNKADIINNDLVKEVYLGKDFIGIV
jgi:lipopolysaccharide export system ATP-binding protein